MRPEMATDGARNMSDTEQERISRKRRSYTRLTEYQRFELNKWYEMNPYLKGKEKEAMARNLGITIRYIENWFKRRRRWEKMKRERH